MTINIVPSMNELLINYIHYPGDLLKTTNLFKTKKVKSAINFWFEFHSILLYTTNNKKKESHANSWSSWIIIKWSDVKCYTDFYVIFHFKKLYCWSADQVFFEKWYQNNNDPDYQHFCKWSRLLNENSHADLNLLLLLLFMFILFFGYFVYKLIVKSNR